MADIKLNSPRLRVIRGSIDAPEILEVQTLNIDLIAYDRTRLRQRPVWPVAQENPWQWLTFLSWHACRRESRIPDAVGYEEWEQSVLQVENTAADDDEDDATGVGDPTPPGHPPG